MANAKTPEAEEPSADGEAPPPKKKFSLKLIIIAAVALAVVGGGGAGAYFMFKGPKEEKHAAPVVKPPTFLDMPEVMVNLSSGGQSERTQYLKVKIVLELPDALLTQQIQPLMPRVLDAFQTFLRELRPTDLDGSAGLYRLKDELTRRVNATIAPNRVNAVLFKEIVVQ